MSNPDDVKHKFYELESVIMVLPKSDKLIISVTSMPELALGKVSLEETGNVTATDTSSLDYVLQTT